MPFIRLDLKGKRPPIFGAFRWDCDLLHRALLWGSEPNRRVVAEMRRTLSLSSEVSKKEVHLCVRGPRLPRDKKARENYNNSSVSDTTTVSAAGNVNTLLIKRSGIANATVRSRPRALLMEGLGHWQSRLEWRVPRGWERRADPWWTTSACRPLTILTVMNGESCLCISTIIYS